MVRPPNERRQRRWFQFSLRTLLIATAAAAGLAFAYLKIVEPYRLQREAMAAITKLGGTYKTEDAVGWVRYLNKDAQDVVVVDLADCDRPDEYLPHLARLPRLRTLVIGGHSVGDEQVAALGRVGSLRGLVLDSTLVTDVALDGLREKQTDLVVWKSERRAVDELGKLRATLQGSSYDVKLPPPRPMPLPPTWLRDDADVRYFNDPCCCVDLAGQPIEDADLTWFNDLRDVKAIWLENTRITGDCFAGADALSSLGFLSLGNTRVNDDTIVHIAQYTNLTHLNLSGTDLSDEGAGRLVACNKLERLFLDGTRITDAGVKHITSLSHLKSFWPPNAMGDQGLANVADLPLLEILSLVDCNVSDEGLEALKRIKGLKNLWCGKRITDKGVPHLEACTGLTHLGVQATSISPSGIDGLQKALPNCYIPRR